MTRPTKWYYYTVKEVPCSFKDYDGGLIDTAQDWSVRCSTNLTSSLCAGYPAF